MNRDRAKEIALGEVGNIGKKAEALLCNCFRSRTGTQSVKLVNQVDYCPLADGCHTNFLVMRCNECGRATGFPNENLVLALRKGTVEAQEQLMDIIRQNRPFVLPVMRRIFRQIESAWDKLAGWI